MSLRGWPRLTPFERNTLRLLISGPKHQPMASSSRERWHKWRLLGFGMIVVTGGGYWWQLSERGREWVKAHTRSEVVEKLLRLPSGEQGRLAGQDGTP